MLMRAYRLSYRQEGRTGRLSQSGLLDLMGQVDEKYSEMHGHSTVARWESGSTLPSRERIEVFGQALNLSPAEVEGLMRLAGFEAGDEQRTGRPRMLEEPTAPVGDDPVDASEEDGPEQVVELGWDEFTSYSKESTRFVFSRFLLPASCVAGAGLILALFGWNATWMVTLYVFIAIGLVLAQVLGKVIPSNDSLGPYSASVFILLSIPLFQAAFTRMDPYGFFTIGSLTNTPLPYLLALLANLTMALAAGLLFGFLRRWQHSTHHGGKGLSYRSAAWTTGLPLLLVLACTVSFISSGVLVYLLSVMPVLAGLFTALVVFREQDAVISDRDGKYLMWAGAALAVVLFAFHGAGILAYHVFPGLISLPNGGLFISWDIDYSALGYPPSELGDRLRLGALWASLASLGYMVVAVAGYLALTVSRQGKEGSVGPPTAVRVSLMLLIGIGGVSLWGNSYMTAQLPDFDAKTEDVWLVPAAVSAENSAEIRARFRNRSSLSGPHGGVATFDVSLVVQPPTGPVVRHHVDNQPFPYNRVWTFAAEHVFDQSGTYTIHAEIYDVEGLENNWDPLHRFDIRSETFTVLEPNGHR